MLLSVIFSFRNEEEVLPELIKRLQNTLRPLGIEYELIFVNDDSSDRSLELLEGYRKRDGGIKIINMSRRFGLGPCLMAGLRHAKGDAVIYMDADLQDPPELIPELLEKWKKGAAVVHTIRTKRKGENPFKMWITKLAYKAINAVANIEILENAGNFKLLSRRAVDEVIQLNEYDPFMIGLARWVGFKQDRVSYERDARFAGKAHFPLLKTVNPTKAFISGLTSFSEVPLYFSLIVGFLVSGGAFCYLVWIIITKFLGLRMIGWSAIMVTMLFLGGTILFAIGVLGLYIGNIHQEVKRRPPYIIESKIGLE